jgi:hypothetical protein
MDFIALLPGQVADGSSVVRTGGCARPSTEENAPPDPFRYPRARRAQERRTRDPIGALRAPQVPALTPLPTRLRVYDRIPAFAVTRLAAALITRLMLRGPEEPAVSPQRSVQTGLSR